VSIVLRLFRSKSRAPDLLFQSSYLKAQGWLAEMNQLCRTPEVQSLGDGKK